MHRPRWKILASISIVVITAAAFIVFFAQNKAVRDQLFNLPPGLIGIMIGLYVVFLLTIAFIFYASLVICRAMIPQREVILVSAYSSVINFFGPLQSGPAFRALYLKKRHGLKLRDYTVASLVYYAFYALFSDLLLLSGFVGWWMAIPVTIGVVAIVTIARSKPAVLTKFTSLPIRGLALVAIATAAQTLVMIVIFYVELHYVDASITIGQALIYTGAANFALFVSITPGAIGFRESFLLLTQRLHGINSDVIVTANLIDRGSYILVLLITIVIIFGSQARKQIQSVRSDDEA